MNHQCNLLPSNSNHRQQHKRRLVVWGLVWGTVAMGMLWFVNVQEKHAADAFNQVRGYEQKLLPVNHVGSKIPGLRNQLENILFQQKLDQELADQQPMLTLLGTLSAAASKGEICITQLQLSQSDHSKSNSNQSTEKFQLTLKGIAIDNLSIANFAGHLRESDCFDQVQLKSTIPEKLANGFARRYEIECRF